MIIPYLLLYYHSKSSPESVLFGFGIVILVLIISWYFSKKNRVKRHLDKYDTKRFTEFQDGEVATTHGMVVLLGKTMRAPLSGRKCSYYYLKVEERRRGSKGGHYWSKIYEKEQAGDVILQQGNQFALVHTDLVQSYLVEDLLGSTGEDRTKDDIVKKMLEEQGINTTTFIFGTDKTLRYSEGVLQRGEIVKVSGKASWKLTRVQEIKFPTMKYLLLEADGKEEVYFTDDPEITQEKEENKRTGSTY